MTDIALIWNTLTGEGDLSFAGGDLTTDAGLQTAVIISLFTDAQAQPGDTIPDGTTNPRGWWGDMPIDTAQQDTSAVPDRIGSRLWLLDRALQTNDTLTNAEAYAKEALQWMLDDGVAGSLTTSASFPKRGWIELVIVINQQGGTSIFTLAWQNS